MKRILFTALAAGALLLAVPAASALASSGPGKVVINNGATPGHFSYNDGVYGPVTCNETHHPSNNLPGSFPAGATTKGGWDEVQCTFDTTVTNFPFGQDYTWYWISDFGTQFDQNLGLYEAHVNGDGTGYHAVAWYPNG
jgi:hypothetical protein